MKRLIFLPTYNERECIKTVVEELRKKCPDADILVVDDNSTDGTLTILNEIASKERHVFLHIRRGERGRGYAEKDAYRFFLDGEYDELLEMDADLSHRIEYVEELFEHLSEHDVVVGSRYCPEGVDVDRSMFRRAMSYVVRLATRVCLNVPLNDPSSGFRAFKRPVVEFMHQCGINAKGPEVVLETTKLYVGGRFSYIEIPIRFIRRAGGKSKVTCSILLTYMRTFLKLICMRCPAR